MLDLRKMNRVKNETLKRIEVRDTERRNKMEKFYADKQKFFDDIDAMMFDGLEDMILDFNETDIEEMICQQLTTNACKNKWLTLGLRVRCPALYLDRVDESKEIIYFGKTTYFTWGGPSHTDIRNLPYNDSMTREKVLMGIEPSEQYNDYYIHLGFDNCEFTWDDFWVRAHSPWVAYFTVNSNGHFYETFKERQYTWIKKFKEYDRLLLFEVPTRYVYRWATKNNISNKIKDVFVRYGVEVFNVRTESYWVKDGNEPNYLEFKIKIKNPTFVED